MIVSYEADWSDEVHWKQMKQELIKFSSVLQFEGFTSLSSVLHFTLLTRHYVQRAGAADVSK